MLGALWSDAIFPGQAPADHRLIRIILGGAHDPSILDLTTDELHKLSIKESHTVMKMNGQPVFRCHFRHPRGIAQYNVGHLKKLEVIEGLERDLPGLFFTGASYRGVSVNGCIKDAVRIRDRFLEQWGAK